MKKRFLVAIASVLTLGLMTCQATVTLNWQSGTSGRVYNQSGIGTGNELTPSVGTAGFTTACFMQLIYTSDGNIYDAGTTGTGILDARNTVVAVAYLGRLVGGTAGQFVGRQYTSSYATGAKFFIRAWNAPSSDLNSSYLTSASIPTTPGANGAIRYGNSIVYTAGDPLLNPIETIDLTNIGSFATTLTPVPEPATLALFGLGAAAIALRRKLRS